jgi:sugar/nucleoside kinase (ribokinase family)
LGGNFVNKILVIGDVIEDLIVIPEESIRPNTDTKAQIQKSMGGQAANVAAWVSHNGAAATFIGCVGSADVVKLEQELTAQGIESHLQSSTKPTGSLVVLVDGQSRSMLTDRGANQDLDLEKIDPTGFGVVYISGYSLLGRSLEQVSMFASKVKAAGALLAIDPGSYGFINDHGVDSFRELISLADIAFPNREEQDLLELSGKVRLNVVTSGHLGAKAYTNNGELVEVASIGSNLVDPTGAGDAFCGGFLARLVQEPDFHQLSSEAVASALRAGAEAGSKAVGIMGARPEVLPSKYP